VRKPVERLLYSGSKAGFQLIGAAARQFSKGPSLDKAQRLPAASKGLFDLSLSEEQQMMRETLQRFRSRRALRPAAHKADHDAVYSRPTFVRKHWNWA
jgi:hypothetical protein